MSVLEIVPHATGVRRVEWTPSDEASVRKARDEFADLTHGAGYLAYRQDGATPAEQIRQFDPAAERIVVVGPLVGG